MGHDSYRPSGARPLGVLPLVATYGYNSIALSGLGLPLRVTARHEAVQLFVLNFFCQKQSFIEKVCIFAIDCSGRNPNN